MEKRPNYLNDFAVDELDGLGGAVGHFRIVGRDDKGRSAFRPKGQQKFEYLFARVGIEVAGRLIRENNRRIVHEGASDRHPLLFAA